jgi:hypothetical protein
MPESKMPKSKPQRRKFRTHQQWVRRVMEDKGKKTPTLADPGRRPLRDAAREAADVEPDDRRGRAAVSGAVRRQACTSAAVAPGRQGQDRISLDLTPRLASCGNAAEPFKGRASGVS